MPEQEDEAVSRTDKIFTLWCLTTFILSPLSFWFGKWCAQAGVHPMVSFYAIILFFGAPLIWRLIVELFNA